MLAPGGRCGQCGSPVDEIRSDVAESRHDPLTGQVVVLAVMREMRPCGHQWVDAVEPAADPAAGARDAWQATVAAAAEVPAAPRPGRHRRDDGARRPWFRRRHAARGT